MDTNGYFLIDSLNGALSRCRNAFRITCSSREQHHGAEVGLLLAEGEKDLWFYLGIEPELLHVLHNTNHQQKIALFPAPTHSDKMADRVSIWPPFIRERLIDHGDMRRCRTGGRQNCTRGN